MRIAVGVFLLLVGAIGAIVTFIFNSQTPMQLGPVPFFAGCAVALVGLIIFIGAL